MWNGEGLDYVYNCQAYLKDYFPIFESKLKDIYTSLTTLNSNISNLDTVLNNINNNLTAFMTNFNSYASSIKSSFNTANIYLSNMHSYMKTIMNDISNIKKWYYPQQYQSGIDYDEYDTLVGWRNFWKTFRLKSFDEVLIEVNQKIQDTVNPLSDNNKDTFNSNLDTLKSDTVYGSALELKDGMQNFYNNVSGASPTASLNVNLLPVSFFSASIPAKTISIDFSWFSPYRDTTLSLWRFFMWLGYIFVLFKHLPNIINGLGLVTDRQQEMQDNLANSYYDMLVSSGGHDDFSEG